jgi:putative FmdB family regulatory protein
MVGFVGLAVFACKPAKPRLSIEESAMPIYEYRCESCGHELEVLQKMSDPVLAECPECKQESLKKMISAVGFRLKGGGWYETDFKNDKKKNVHESGDSASKPSTCSGGNCGCHS